MTNIVMALLLSAMINVESRGNDQAIGDHGQAYGCLQIHKECVEHVNQVYGTTYTHRDMFVRSNALDVATKYLQITSKKLKHKTVSNLARQYNGGPRGAWNTSTKGYGLKVSREYMRLTKGA